MTETRIRVLIVDDYVIVRQGIRAILAESEDVHVVGEARNGLEAIQQAASLKPDVILMDLVMPKMDGIEAIRQITDQNPGMRILVLTTYSGDDKVFPAIKAGANGYLLKDSGSGQLLQAIREVHRGEPSLHPDIARKIMREISQSDEVKLTPTPLTARELEVLKLLASGMENEEIADQLIIAEVTVRSHISRILAKLHLANRVQATLYALREGLVNLDEDQ
jgi:NarL family two-component system response regulator LiaR